MKIILLMIVFTSFTIAQENNNEDDKGLGRLTRQARQRRLQNFNANREKFKRNVERINFASRRVQAGESQEDLASERINTASQRTPVAQERLQFASDRMPTQRAFDTGARPNNQKFNQVGTDLNSTDFN